MFLATQSQWTTQESLSIRDAQMFLVRRRKLIIILFILTFGLVALITFLTPEEYESHMKLLVKNDRADLVISPDGRSNADLHSSELSETEMNSEIELMRSNDIMHDVVVRCRLDQRNSDAVHASSSPTPSGMEAATVRLTRKLSISAVKKSNVIQVSYLDRSAEGAKQVLDQLADAYLAAHLRLHGSPGTEQFFHQQTQFYDQQVRKTEADLSEFRERNNIITLQQEKDMLLTRAMDVQREAEGADAAVSQYTMTLADAQRQISKATPRVLTQTRVIPNQYSVERLNTMLVDLKNKRTEMAAKFRSDDRLVTELDQEISDTQAALDRAQAGKSTENVTDVNPLNESLQKDAASAQLQLAGVKARRESLTTQLAQYRGRLIKLENVTSENDALQRKLKEAEDNYELYSKKEEEARIAQSLDEQKIANVAIAEHPTVPIRPDRPKVAQDLVLGFLLSCFVSIGVALALEYLTAHSAIAPTLDPLNSHLLETNVGNRLA
jgi:uncharacterized protein involved in exopolysaccharide biosynthesis